LSAHETRRSSHIECLGAASRDDPVGFAPAPLLEHLVTAGYLGRRAGRGFRDYS
jgi:3-hydroxyacyl-CoA dehydrogenase